MKQQSFPPSPINDALFKACAKGTFEEIRTLLDKGADPALPHWEEAWCDGTPEDYFCIHEAAKNTDIRILDLLVEHGADPCMSNFYDQQSLAYAGRFNTFEMVKHLVELGNDPSRYDLDGGSVLSWSAANPDIRVLEFLLDNGAEIGGCADGQTELDEALRSGTPDRIRFLVAHGAAPDFISNERIKSASLENIRALLECGYDPNCREDGWGNDGPLLVDVLDSERRALFMEFIEKT